MDNKRNYIRFFSELSARYFLENGVREWKECTIMNVSRKGMGIRYHTNETIDAGATVHIEIPLPLGLEVINVVGVLKWIGREADHFMGGIELTEELDGDRLDKLEKID